MTACVTLLFYGPGRLVVGMVWERIVGLGEGTNSVYSGSRARGSGTFIYRDPISLSCPDLSRDSSCIYTANELA